MRVGFAGLVHGHVWGLIDRFAETPDVQLAAVADATPLMENARSRFAESFTDWRDMLESGLVDSVVVTTDNLEGAEVAVQALGRGLHVFIEKPMAANAPDAQRVLDAWEQ
jgi:predicted dehydrogenase